MSLLTIFFYKADIFFNLFPMLDLNTHSVFLKLCDHHKGSGTESLFARGLHSLFNKYSPLSVFKRTGSIILKMFPTISRNLR